MATNKTRIKIRHGSGKPDTGTDGLLPYELGWDDSYVALYINNNGTIKQINSESTVGIPLASGDNVDTLRPGIYYSGSSAMSGTLNGTKPNGDTSGFRLEVIRGYSYNYGIQIAYDSTSSIKIRKNPVYHSESLNYSDFTGIPWRSIITSTDVASKTSIGIVTTGAQNFLGRKGFGYINSYGYNDSGTAVRWVDQVYLCNAAGTMVAQRWYDCGDATNITTGQFTWREYSPNSPANTSTTGKYEDYLLPAVNTGRTGNASYNIITTKNPADLGYYLPLSGGTMTNTAKFVSGSGIYTEGNPMLYFLSGSASSYQKQGAIFTDSTTVNSKRVCSRLYFREYSYNSSTGAAVEQWDQYRLPAVAANKTSSNSYEILTSKSVVTIAQGGTGAGGPEAAANNLLSGLPAWTANPNDDTYFIRRDTAGSAAFGQVKASTIYNYVKGKTDTLYVKKAGDTMTGHLTAPSTSCSWLTGQNAANAAFNIGDATNTGSYWPWMRQTNTSSSKWFSFGTLNTSFYWMGSATSRTENGYDYGMQFNVANGYLQGCSKVYGAVWNDYAEYRKDNPNENQEPGRCIKELGDGSLALTTKRLERGCEIVSDTFGFAIGQDEENGYNTPIASNGRVLAYPYESIEEFTTHIGWPVCSGPNGTVSIMTEEEEEKYPSRIIGTISEIPNYEEWGTGKVKVDGRVWIKVH